MTWPWCVVYAAASVSGLRVQRAPVSSRPSCCIIQVRLVHGSGEHVICRSQFVDLRCFAPYARAITGAQCRAAASSFSLPARRNIVGGTCFNANMIGVDACA